MDSTFQPKNIGGQCAYHDNLITLTVLSLNTIQTEWVQRYHPKIWKKIKIIIPSQMEVAPPHRTVDITQKTVLSKNTKEAEKILKG